VRSKVAYIEPMLLLKKDALPDDLSHWIYEIKLDGFRAVAFKTAGEVNLPSRNDNDFTGKYPEVVRALSGLPDETVIDGEIVALDEDGRPSFNVLQNYGSSKTPIHYFVFDVMLLAGRDVMKEPLIKRRELLQARILSKLAEPIRFSPELDAPLPDLIRSVKTQGLEGLVAKRRNSLYEPGLRSGAWQKMRLNQGQEFVIGGYTVGGRTFDAVVFGYYEGGKLIYAARTRNGFTPSSREELMNRFKKLKTAECPFANLPEAKSGRWGAGLTKAKMADCRWLKPVLMGQFEYVEWTPEGHLRHSKFVGLRDDKKVKDVVRES
jgi:DNA ligase D-like protein (predicted ligase)